MGFRDDRVAQRGRIDALEGELEEPCPLAAQADEAPPPCHRR